MNPRFKWWLRKPIYRWRVRRLWIQQGRPRDMFVVLQQGLLIQDGDQQHITDWCWEGSYMTVPLSQITAEQIWDRLSARYPVVRL